MKKFVILCLLAVSFSVQAQFYISTSGGYGIPSAGIKLGTETTPGGIENFYGSYGEGIHAQLRSGYFFNSNFGTELALGYLHGQDQTINKITIPGQPFVDIRARGRALGVSLSLVYKFNDHIYGRFGGLVKVGGQTEALGKVKGVGLPAGSLPGVPIATTLNLEFEQHYNGKLPIGFVGAIGYKYKLNRTIGVFAELEYTGISITRDSATMESFSAILRETGTELSIDQTRAVFQSGGNPLASALYKDIDFVDELPLTNTDGSKQLAQKVPYSSFGINFGLTFTLSKHEKKEMESYIDKNGL
jgi:hypothetical protein